MHVERGDGVVQKRQIVAAEGKAAQHQIVFQQRQQIIHFEAAFQQGEGLCQSVQKRLAAAELHVGNRIGQSLRATLRLPEHGFDIGAVGLDIGGEHGNIVRLPIGVLGQKREQLVFQNVQLTQGAVGGVNADGAVGRRIIGLGGGQAEGLDIVLQALQQSGRGLRFIAEIAALFADVRFGERIEEIAPLLAQRSEQRVAALAQINVVAALQDLRRFNHIAPIFAAWVERENVHIAMLGHGF